MIVVDGEEGLEVPLVSSVLVALHGAEEAVAVSEGQRVVAAASEVQEAVVTAVEVQGVVDVFEEHLAVEVQMFVGQEGVKMVFANHHLGPDSCDLVLEGEGAWFSSWGAPDSAAHMI